MEKLVDHKKKQSNLPREATESLGLPNTPNDSYESLYLKAQLQSFQTSQPFGHLWVRCLCSGHCWDRWARWSPKNSFY
jgi:hypothetical protein